MDQKNSDFIRKLLSTFKIEAAEHIQAISSGLLELEKAPNAERQRTVIETLLREAHSLKGAARAVNQNEVEAVCQSLETVFATLKHEEVPPSQALFDLFHQTINSLGNLLVFTEVKRTASEKAWFRKLLHRLENAAKAEFQQPIEEVKIWNEGHLKVHKAEGQQPLAEEKLTPAETVRISTAKLGSLLLQTEELLSAKVAASQRAAELKEIKTAFGTWKKEWAKYRIGDPGLRNAELKKDQLPYPQLNEFLGWNSSFAKSLESQVTSLTRA